MPETLYKIQDDLGEILTGNINYNTPYKVKLTKLNTKFKIKLGETKFCELACSVDYTQEHIDKVKWLIEKHYSAHW